LDRVPDQATSAAPESAAMQPRKSLPALMTRWPVRVTTHRVLIAIVLLLALAFYMWTAASSVPFQFGTHNTDLYNELLDSFLHGHTYLPGTPPAGLLHLQNPYDPAQNAPYQAKYHDLALRNGHFYAPWGPAPAVTLYLLFRITTLQISESFAAALFAFIGLVCAVALLHVLVRRLLPATPRWLLVVASAGLALTNVAPFLLRRPAMYEVAISAGYCFAMAGGLLIVTAVFAPRHQRRRLALGSLCLGVAVGARPTLIACGAVALGAALYLMRRRGEGYGVLVAALAPFIVCGLLLAAYNQVRFGSISEFGQRYQLAGLDVSHKPTGDLSYVPPGVFSYLLVPPRVAVTFPHVFFMTDTEYPGTLPAGYTGTPTGGSAEPTGGLLPTMPITLLLLALPVLWRRRERGERAPLLASATLAVLGLAIVVELAYALWGTTQRYEVDYATFFLLASFLVWAVLVRRYREQDVARRAIVAGGVLLTAIGCAVGTAVSITGYYDALRLTHPGVFATLEDITSPFATAATMIAGKAAIARVDNGAAPVDLPPITYGTVSEGGAGTWMGQGPVTVVVDAPSGDHLVLKANAVLGPGVRQDTGLVLNVRSPGTAPVSVPVRRGELRMPIRVRWGLNRIVLRLSRAPIGAADALRLNGLTVSR
jgi:hypothetical protein